MLIRDERPDDSLIISQIHYVAFKNHPVHPPGSEPVEHHIVERLRACGHLTLSLVAETGGEGGEVAGHIALSPAVVGQERTGWFLLGPVGLLPRFQGQGIGSALVREALLRMRAMGAAGVVLVGDPGFYARFGFANVPGQYVLAACLGGTAPQGGVAAHEAFGVPDAKRPRLPAAGSPGPGSPARRSGHRLWSRHRQRNTLCCVCLWTFSPPPDG